MLRPECVLRAVASLAISCAVGIQPALAQESEAGTPAVANVQDASGHALGQVVFRQVAEGVEVEGDLHDIPGGAGMHGVHIHEVGACDPPDFMSTGGHYNPTGRQHGVDNPDGPHVGDVVNLDDPNAGSNIDVTPDGTAHLHGVAMEASVGPGAQSLLDEDGAAIVIHAGQDDNVSNPAGNSGARVACGVLAAAEQ
jgi:superoxide dismutase, Cu-Zn family